MTPSQVEDRVLELIHGNEAIAGTVAMPARVVRIIGTTRDRILQFEPGVEGDLGAASTVVWIVRAEGTFTTLRGIRRDPPVATSGFYVLSDADGSVVAFGFP